MEKKRTFAYTWILPWNEYENSECFFTKLYHREPKNVAQGIARNLRCEGGSTEKLGKERYAELGSGRENEALARGKTFEVGEHFVRKILLVQPTFYTINFAP